MIVAMQSLLMLCDPVRQPVVPLYWKTSALRILLASTLLLSGALCAHLLIVASLAGLVPVVVTVLIFLGIGILSWHLSGRHPQTSAAILTAATYGAGATMILFNSLPEVMRIGALYLCLAPLFCWVFFSWQATLLSMATNTLVFVWMLGNPAPIMLFGLDLSMPYSIEYVHISIFVFFNLGIPLVLMRVRRALDNSLRQHAEVLGELQEHHALYLDVFEHAGSATLICAEDGRILHANAQASVLLERDLAQEQPLLQALLQDAPRGTLAALAGAGERCEYRLLTRGAGERRLRLRIRPLHTAQRYLVTLQDRTEVHRAEIAQQRSEERARYLELHDPLTDLPNQQGFEQLLQAYCDAAGKRPMLLVHLRLNNIRQINDRHGVLIGNRVIRHLGRTLAQLADVVEGACVARLRGLVFASLLPLPRGANSGEDILQAWLERLPRSFLIDAQAVHLNYSIGALVEEGGERTATDLLRLAERTLDEARSAQGLTPTLLSPALLRRIEREARVEAALLDAIAAGELHLHYQPKVWADGRIECVEALLRWQSPRLGAVGPDEFIPLAERNGQIHAITAQVVELACAQQAAWRRDGIAAPPIAINLSGRDLHGGEIAEQLFDALERHDLPAYALQLEITETALIENEAMALAQLQELSRHGFAIALDDFGTGHSSLNKLSEYPISVIKIDRSFIAGIGSHARREQIVKATLSLARDLGCRSVAEGVENEAQLDFLRSHGCDLFQGYHLHRPMPANDLTALLAAAAA